MTESVKNHPNNPANQPFQLSGAQINRSKKVKKVVKKERK
jgi:hypothetical protein